MEDSNDLPSGAQLAERLESGAHEEARAGLSRYEAASAEKRKDALQALCDRAAAQPTAFAPVLSEFVPFLTDAEQSIRLTTAKLFVALAEEEPEAVSAVVPALADRLADEDEFYYVRARSAEALGYVGRVDPAAVASPEVLADLRIGLSFDEPEVKEKLAKALEHVALGRPRRLKHHAPSLAEQLSDDNELVRYHVCTAITVVGCEFPEEVAECHDALGARLDDDSPYVRGRAAEALGLLAHAGEIEESVREERLAALTDDENSFVRRRAQFAGAGHTERTDTASTSAGIGTVDGIRNETDAVVEEITTPDDEGTCAQCGLALPEHGPPVCPRCGTPN